MGKGAWIDTSPERMYRWPLDAWKDGQCHESAEKWQVKTQWDITSHLSECLSSINQQTTSDGEGVEEGEHFCPVGGNADWCGHCGKQ